MNQEKLQPFLQIGTQIQALRKELGLTQIEFAKRAGVGLRFLRELEQGKITVRMDKVVEVLDFLGYHLEIKRNETTLLKAIKEKIQDQN